MAKSRFTEQKRVVLAGSERKPFEVKQEPEGLMASAAGGAKAPGGKITVSVFLKRKTPVATKTLGKKGAVLSRAEFAKKHGPDPAAVKAVQAFAKEYGLLSEKPVGGACSMAVSGPRAAMEKAFGVTLTQVKTADGTFRVRQGGITLPEELTQYVTAVLGLDNRPQAEPHFRVLTAKAAGSGYSPVQVAQLYGFPAGAKATGQTIGIVELGGGYRATDLKTYFKGLGLTAPTVTAVSVDQGKNTPGTADGADGEVMLDIEVAAAVAQGAKVAVYFAPNTDQGFIDAISTAVHDTTNKPSVVSISWGGPESTWTAQAMTALDSACQAAAALGVTITVASGDNGSSDGVTDGGNHVDFPASSPHVLGCGGTKLTGSGSTITSEVVWNEQASDEGATGGGVSAVFALPAWQKNANVPAPTGGAGGRGVPDVAGDADPTTGYIVRVDGQSLVIGGTSAVAPLWAGLIALANAQNKAAAGFINPTIYAAGAAKVFRDITSGNNGAFTAGPGWDACTGLGSPVGTAVIKALAAAGTTSGKGKAVVKAAAKKQVGPKVKQP